MLWKRFIKRKISKNGRGNRNDCRTVKRGKGKSTYTDGKVYEGDFKDGKAHGEGKLTFPDGQVREGDFFEEQEVNGKGLGKHVEPTPIYTPFLTPFF